MSYDPDAAVKPLFASAGILGAAYKGKDILNKTLLTHAVPTADIKIGKLSRSYGQALCVKTLNTVDEQVWEDVDQTTCDRCNEILDRIGVK